MAKNYTQAGEHLTFPAPADVASGDLVVVGALVGVAEVSALAGQPVTLARRGVFILPKTTGQAWAVGAKVHWDATNRLVTTTASGNTLIGVVAEAAIAAATAGEVLLDGAIR